MRRKMFSKPIVIYRQPLETTRKSIVCTIQQYSLYVFIYLNENISIFFSKGVHIIMYTFMLNTIFIFYFIRRLCNRNQNVMAKGRFLKKNGSLQNNML